MENGVCCACHLPIIKGLIEERPDVWVHEYSRDWMCWRCPNCARTGGTHDWWNRDGFPTCPSCGTPLVEDHQADPDNRGAGAIRKVGELVESFLKATNPVT